MALTVVFDFGAVLFHWDPGGLVRRHVPAAASTVWSKVGPDAGPGVGADAVQGDLLDAALADRFFGGFRGDWAEFDRGTLDQNGIVRSIVIRTGWPADQVAAAVDAVPEALHVDPPTFGVLESLWNAGVRTLFLSNMPAPYADVLERRHGFLKRFDGGLFSARIGLIKPEPAVFAAMVDRFALDPAQTVLIDDSGANVDAARRCGWQAIHYRDGDDCQRQLAALGLPVRSIGSVR